MRGRVRLPARIAGGVGATLAAAALLAGCFPSASGADASADARAQRLVAQGEEVFRRKAGTLSAGCSFCHGENGQGNLAPAIQGKSVEEIRKALETVPQMTPLKLSEADIQAVAVFLQRLK